jgi:DNA-binding GntR family transcriptional regulator
LSSSSRPPFENQFQSIELVTSGLADEIALRLAQGILEGEFAPGDPLSQSELCTRFGVSRTPVREALRKLQAQNLVVVRTNRGATVRVPTRIELEEAWIVRAELESFGCELACARMTPDLLEELAMAQERIERAEEALTSEQADGNLHAELTGKIVVGNELFHSTILRAASNSKLQSFCESLQSYLPKDYVWRAVEAANVTRLLNVDQHRQIYDALQRRDNGAARRAMRAHISQAGTVLIDYLSERGFWDARDRLAGAPGGTDGANRGHA